VLGPSPHDGHHGHEVAGRATHAALEGSAVRPRWWMWTLWGHAPTPTLFVDLDEPILERAADALAAHRGELARADYIRLLRARAEVASVLGAEQVFGWGSPRRHAAYAEILTEVLSDRGGWPLANARGLDPADALGGAEPHGVDLGEWLRSASPRTVLLGPCGDRARHPPSM
jgi:hypothetical protein